MPGLVQFDSRSDAGFGCFTALCTDALQRRHCHALWARVWLCVRRRPGCALLVCYWTLARQAGRRRYAAPTD